MRILATRATVETLFRPCLMPYAYTDEHGDRVTCTLPGWECKQCGFKSLYGIKNLPMPHECDVRLHGTTTVGQTFATNRLMLD